MFDKHLQEKVLLSSKQQEIVGSVRNLPNHANYFTSFLNQYLIMIKYFMYLFILRVKSRGNVVVVVRVSIYRILHFLKATKSMADGEKKEAAFSF